MGLSDWTERSVRIWLELFLDDIAGAVCENIKPDSISIVKAMARTIIMALETLEME